MNVCGRWKRISPTLSGALDGAPSTSACCCFGWRNGPRLSGFQDMLVNAPNPAIGFQADAARPLAIVGALSETLGGLMLVVGLFTPLAASAVLGVMLVAAAYKATLAGGVWFFASGGRGAGIEYELLLAVR